MYAKNLACSQHLTGFQSIWTRPGADISHDHSLIYQHKEIALLELMQGSEEIDGPCL